MPEPTDAPSSIEVPELLDLHFVLRGFRGVHWAGTSPPGVVTALHPPGHAEPIALAAVAAWAMRVQREGVGLKVGDAVKSRYTLNTGLLAALAGKLPWSDEVTATGEFFPLCRVSGERRVDAIPSGVVTVLPSRDDEAKGALAGAIHEIVRNAEEHSGGVTPAAFCAGWFRIQRRTTFAVADTGVGILRHLRAKGVATMDDDHRTAIEKAIQPLVTGAGKRGEIRAPHNAGLGLHNTRVAALDSGGEWTILTGDACRVETAAGGEQWFPVENPWQGTLVSVTIVAERSSRLRVSPATIGAVTGGLIRWVAAPAEATVLTPPVDSARFAMNKAWYKAHQPGLAVGIAAGHPFHIDFGGARYSTQSALHAFLAEVVTVHGSRALTLLTFANAAEPLKDALRLVVTYALEAHHSERAPTE